MKKINSWRKEIGSWSYLQIILFFQMLRLTLTPSIFQPPIDCLIWLATSYLLNQYGGMGGGGGTKSDESKLAYIRSAVYIIFWSIWQVFNYRCAWWQPKLSRVLVSLLMAIKGYFFPSHYLCILSRLTGLTTVLLIQLESEFEKHRFTLKSTHFYFISQ